MPLELAAVVTPYKRVKIYRRGYSQVDISMRQASLSRATKQLMPTPRGRRPPPLLRGEPGEGLVYRTGTTEYRGRPAFVEAYSDSEPVMHFSHGVWRLS